MSKLKNRLGFSTNESQYGIIALLQACAKQKNLSKGIRIHADILQKGLLEKNPYVGSTLITMYAKCGALEKAHQVFDKLPKRNLVAWTALIAGYVESQQGKEALKCFWQMQADGLSPDWVTYLCILKACGSLSALDEGKRIHDEVAEKGLIEKYIMLGNALVDMYVKCKELRKAQQVLDELPIRNVVSWNSLISGYVKQDQEDDALKCYHRVYSEGLHPDTVTFICMLKACANIKDISIGKRIHYEIVNMGLLGSDAALGNALVDMYAKCGEPATSAKVLSGLPIRDVVSWNSVMAGYVQQGQGNEALNCFKEFQSEYIAPNSFTFLCLLNACAITKDVEFGRNIHQKIISEGLLVNNTALGNALVDMYVTCGDLLKAEQAFNELPVHDKTSFTALTSGYVEQECNEKRC